MSSYHLFHQNLQVLLSLVSSQQEKRKSSDWLQEFRKSDDAWVFCMDILNQQECNNEGKILGSQILVYKARRQPVAPSIQEIEALLRMSFFYLISGVLVIAIQLALAACASILRNLSCDASRLLPDIIYFCKKMEQAHAEEVHLDFKLTQTSDSLLFLVLGLLPEEASSLKASPQRREEISHQLKLQISSVLLPLANEKLASHNDSFSGSSVAQVLKCLASWKALEGALQWNDLKLYPRFFDAASAGLIGQDSFLSEQALDFFCVAFEVYPPSEPAEEAAFLLTRVIEICHHSHPLLENNEQLAKKLCMLAHKCGSCLVLQFECPKLAFLWDKLADILISFTVHPSLEVCTEALSFWQDLGLSYMNSPQTQQILIRAFASIVQRSKYNDSFESANTDEKNEMTELRKYCRDILRDISLSREQITSLYLEAVFKYLGEHAADDLKWQETETHLHALSAISKGICSFSIAALLLQGLSNLSGHPAVQRSAGLVLCGLAPALSSATIHADNSLALSAAGRLEVVGKFVQLALQTLGYSDDEGTLYPMRSQQDHIGPVCLLKICSSAGKDILQAGNLLQLILFRFQETLTSITRGESFVSLRSFVVFAKAIASLAVLEDEAALAIANSTLGMFFQSIITAQGSNHEVVWILFESVGIVTGSCQEAGLVQLRCQWELIHKIVSVSAQTDQGIECCCTFFWEISTNKCLTLQDVENCAKMLSATFTVHPQALQLRALEHLLKGSASAVWESITVCIHTALPILAFPNTSEKAALTCAAFFNLMRTCVEKIPCLCIPVLQNVLSCCCCCLEGTNNIKNVATINFLRMCYLQESPEFKAFLCTVMKSGMGEAITLKVLEAVLEKMPSNMLNALVDFIQVLYANHGLDEITVWLWTAINTESSQLNATSTKVKQQFVESCKLALYKSDWRALKVLVKGFCGGKKKQSAALKPA